MPNADLSFPLDPIQEDYAMKNDPARRYRTEAVSTQQKGKLIVMLYEGAIGFLKTAKEKLREEDYALKGVYIGKAMDIVSELNNCLDMESAPEIADDLRALYNFLYRHLTRANIERSPEMIDECMDVLENLCEAWREVSVTTAGNGTPDLSESENNGVEA